MIAAAALSMLLAAGPAGEVQVDVGRARFEAMPQIRMKHSLPTVAMVEKVQKILASGACRALAASSNRFDITIPYAVELNPDGSTRHVLVADKGCPDIERFVGQVVVQLAAQGEFTQNGPAASRWHASEINFTLE